MNQVVTFEAYLEEKLSDPQFKQLYEMECEKLDLARRIAEVRQEAGLTQKELAERMLTKQQTISRLENGHYDRYTLKTLQKIALCTGTKLEIDFVR